jgi:hypothetical protein
MSLDLAAVIRYKSQKTALAGRHVAKPAKAEGEGQMEAKRCLEG